MLRALEGLSDSCGRQVNPNKMEREEYQNQINDLLQAVETLLNSNKVMGERVAHLERVAEAYEDLKAKYEKLEGELAMRKRGQ